MPATEGKEIMKNTTDTECGYVNQPGKSRFGYITQITADTTHDIMIGVDVTPANKRELLTAYFFFLVTNKCNYSTLPRKNL